MNILQRLIQAQPANIRRCRECDTYIGDKRSDATYCSNRCRMRCSRRGEQAPSLATSFGLERRCSVCGDRTTGARSRYCGSSCRNRASRARHP